MSDLTPHQLELLRLIAAIDNVNEYTWLYISMRKPIKRFYEYWEFDSIEPVIIKYKKCVANALYRKRLLDNSYWGLYQLTQPGMKVLFDVKHE